MKKFFMLASVVCLSLVFAACTNPSSDKESNPTEGETSETDTDQTQAQDPDGTIVVEAREGTLSGAEPSTRDFIQEISTGHIAYLGSVGATATYTVPATAAGTYKLSIMTSDDDVWETGYRDANVTVNGVHVLTYKHISENTNGWKWFTLGNVSLKEGDNTIAFTKANDMPAAFAMLQFKLVPVLVQ